MITLPETNMSPENRRSRKESSLPTIHFQGRTVRFGGGHLTTSAPWASAWLNLQTTCDHLSIGKLAVLLGCQHVSYFQFEDLTCHRDHLTISNSVEWSWREKWRLSKSVSLWLHWWCLVLLPHCPNCTGIKSVVQLVMIIRTSKT